MSDVGTPRASRSSEVEPPTPKAQPKDREGHAIYEKASGDVFGSPDDMRHLIGRVLSDVLRSQVGEEGFNRLETIRKKSVAFHRASPEDAAKIKAELDALLTNQELPTKLNIIRAFSYTSHLLNIAEDVEVLHNERENKRARGGPERGSIKAALQKLREKGVSGETIHQWLSQMIISPVLTAHPTEVQRKSIQDCQREVSRLLQLRTFSAVGGVSSLTEEELKVRGRTSNSKSDRRNAGWLSGCTAGLPGYSGGVQGFERRHNPPI